MGLFDKPLNFIDGLVAREAVLHLQDGETTIRGFLLDFYPDAVRLAKPVLLIPDAQPSELGGEALVFKTEIKFIQLLGG